MLIGIASLNPQSGKTTVANILKETHLFRHGEISDSVSVLASKFFGFNGNKLESDQRKILQELGICGANIDPTLWLYATMSLMRKKILGPFPDFVYFSDISIARHIISQEGIDAFFGRTVNGKKRNIVIGGIRSPAEADEILKLGGKTIVVLRGDGGEDDHAIENKLNDYANFSYTVENNGTIEDLKEKINEIIDGF